MQDNHLLALETDSLVAGTWMNRSLGAFMHACEVALGAEQAKLAPDTHLIALLCDAVRLARESASATTSLPSRDVVWDAARYRYLRTCAQGDILTMDGLPTWSIPGLALPVTALTFDAAVDAAMVVRKAEAAPHE